MPGFWIEVEGRVPTLEEVRIAKAGLYFRTRIIGPQILERMKERKKEDKEVQRKFRKDSELLQPGEPDILGKLHQSSNSRGGGLMQKIIADEVKSGRPRRKKNWREDRERMAENIKKMKEEKWIQEDIINLAFAQAEEWDRKNWWRRKKK